MNKETKTMVILAPAFPANESETVWVRPKQLFVRKLKENFPSLNIIVLSFNYPYDTREYSWHGIRVIPFNGMRTRKLQRLLLWMKVTNRLRRIINDHSVMGIFSFWCGECALVGRRFATRHGIKHFIWISGMDAKKENKLVKWIKPKPGDLIAMSTFLVKQFYKNHAVKPAYTVPIGIDVLEFNGVSGTRDIDILGVGSLNPFKQYDLLIHIVKELSHSFPAIRAVICGDGTEKPRLEKLVKDLQLESNIKLLGLTTHPEVLQFMQRTRVFLHPSRYEGFGAVCLEALYGGASVISFCDPMEIKVERWYIAKNNSDMKQKAFEILSNGRSEHVPVLLYSMDDTAKTVMNLFEHSNT